MVWVPNDEPKKARRLETVPLLVVGAKTLNTVPEFVSASSYDWSAELMRFRFVLAAIVDEKAPIVALAVSCGKFAGDANKLNVPLDGNRVPAAVPVQFVVRLKLVFVPLHVRSWAEAGDICAIAKPPHTTAKAVRISRLNPFRRSFPAMIEPPRRKEPKLPWTTLPPPTARL